MGLPFIFFDIIMVFLSGYFRARQLRYLIDEELAFQIKKAICKTDSLFNRIGLVLINFLNFTRIIRISSMV